MAEQFPLLVDFDTRLLPQEETGVLVIGSGAAGLSAALAAAEEGSRVTLAVKSGFLDTATDLAQGGIAAAIGAGDSPESHFTDTMNVTVGLADPEAVRVLVGEAPEVIARLVENGAQFTRRPDGTLDQTREGGHSEARIVYASGDRSGAEIIRTLSPMVLRNRRIEIRERYFLVDFLVAGGRVAGALFYEEEKQALIVVRAAATVLASGGFGQVFQETTNPAISTGDGQACAWRAGAVMRDLEFVQFHPTSLYIAGAPRFLVSEAVRGEGAFLVNIRGERFMRSYHPLEDLAPRDVVARAIVDQMKRWGTGHVFLDARNLKVSFRERFPSIYTMIRRFRLDPETDLIPVRPAVHYAMGGVKTGLHGETNLERLFACGEAACSGVHGANRLASNSLLECLVFGRRAGRAAAACRAGTAVHFSNSRPSVQFQLDVPDLRRSLNTLAWRRVGIERSGVDLEDALGKIRQWQEYALLAEFKNPSDWEVQNMLLLAGLITAAALRRTESRGAHFRLDFPERDDAQWLRHIDQVRGQEP